MLKLDLSAVGNDVTITSFNLTRTGTATNTDIEALSVYLDTNDNEILDTDEDGDEEIIRVRRGFVKNKVFIPIDLSLPKDETETVFVSLNISEIAYDSMTIGLRIAEPRDVVFEPGVLTLTPLHLTNSYIGKIEENITIDGAFGDWNSTLLRSDTYNDVRLGNENIDNANIDILRYNIQQNSGNLSFYFDVSGTMFGGVIVPWNASRPVHYPPSEFIDSDGDGILDQDEQLGQVHDFDNDVGLPDDPNTNWTDTGEDGFDQDSDNDGIEDWPWGNDTKLVQPVTGRIMYIGPSPPIPKLPVVTGEDVAYIFIDTDNDASTGFYVNEYIGADFMLNLSGKGNIITSKNLNIFNSSNVKEWKWDFVDSVNAAIDSKALEAQIEFDVLGIPQNRTFMVWFFTTDWRDCFDLSDNGITETRSNRGTRAKPPGAGSKVVLNEIFPDANGWIELYNKGNNAVDISGWVITWDGSSYTIPSGTTIQAGGFLAFDVGSVPSSATVTLYNDKAQERDTTTYSSVPSGEGWGRYPDGEDNWIYTTPTKAAANQPATPPPSANVLINEVYPDTNGWVELYNTATTGGPTDISGWTIVWSGGTYTIPLNTKIKKNEFLAFDVGNIPATDTVTLYDDTSVEQDNTSFSSISSGYGWGRYPDGTGSWWVTIPTKAAANIIPEFSDIIPPLMFTILIFGLVRYRKNKGSKKEEKKMKGMKAEDQEMHSISLSEKERVILSQLIDELVSISDISGAGIVKVDGSVISWHTNTGLKPTPYIDFLMDFLAQDNRENAQNYKHGMFRQSIMSFNGHKILMSRISPDMMLMLLMDKRAYLVLTMPDMEGCLREIDKVIDGVCI